MGVDFTMQCVIPKDNNQFEKVDGKEFFFYMRDHYLTDIFDIKWNKQIKQFLKKEVSFEWYNKRFSYLAENFHEPNLGYCFDPKIILECIKEVWNVIKENNSKLPITYLTSKNKKNWDYNNRFFYNGKPYHVSGTGDGDLTAVPSKEIGWDSNNVPEINLSDMTEFECNDSIRIENENGKWTVKEGEEITLYIKKSSFRDEYKFHLKWMISVCENAIKNNYLIFTYIS